MTVVVGSLFICCWQSVCLLMQSADGSLFVAGSLFLCSWQSVYC